MTDQAEVTKWNGWIKANGRWLLDIDFAIDWVLARMSDQEHKEYFGKRISCVVMDMSTRDRAYEAVEQYYPWIDGPDEDDIRKAQRRASMYHKMQSTS